MNEFITEDRITEDRKCGRCGTPVEGFTSEPADEVANSSGWRVVLSVWTTLEPCGCTFRRATGANLD